MKTKIGWFPRARMDFKDKKYNFYRENALILSEDMYPSKNASKTPGKMEFIKDVGASSTPKDKDRVDDDAGQERKMEEQVDKIHLQPDD